ncbi:MAG: hypothetical protein ACRDI2_26050, partial [Chloroflexota bacterium]
MRPIGAKDDRFRPIAPAPLADLTPRPSPGAGPRPCGPSPAPSPSEMEKGFGWGNKDDQNARTAAKVHPLSTVWR